MAVSGALSMVAMSLLLLSIGFFGARLVRKKRGLASTLAGPAFEFLNRSASLTLGNLAQLAKGKNTNFGRELVDYFNRFLLPGSSLWYSRLAKDRLIIDNLQELVDPDHFRKRRARMARLARKERDQAFFWRPGDTFPSRAPDPTQAFRINPRR